MKLSRLQNFIFVLDFLAEKASFIYGQLQNYWTFLLYFGQSRCFWAKLSSASFQELSKQRCVPGNQYELAGKMREPWKNRPYFLAEKPVLFIGNNKIGHFSGRKCCTIFSNLLGSFMKSISCVCSKKCKQSCALLPGNQHLFAGKMRDPWQNTKSLKCWKDDVKANLEF